VFPFFICLGVFTGFSLLLLFSYFFCLSTEDHLRPSDLTGCNFLCIIDDSPPPPPHRPTAHSLDLDSFHSSVLLFFHRDFVFPPWSYFLTFIGSLASAPPPIYPYFRPFQDIGWGWDRSTFFCVPLFHTFSFRTHRTKVYPQPV